jgi:hypothetical protein
VNATRKRVSRERIAEHCCGLELFEAVSLHASTETWQAASSHAAGVAMNDVRT